MLTPAPEPLLDDERLQALKREQHRYWRKNMLITVSLLLCWFLITYVCTYYAKVLNQFSLFGFPLGFYFTAQGALLGYVLIVGIYAQRMNRHDDVYRQALLELQQQYRTTVPAPAPRTSRL